MVALASRILLSVGGVLVITVGAHTVVPLNATTVAFTYLVLVLLIASTWGFIESVCASVAATLAFNFFFLPPVGTFTIADPQNWVALFSFLTTSLVASRLSTKAKERARDAIERQRDVERLYTFSRAILLIDTTEHFQKQLVLKLAEIFDLDAVVLFDRRSTDFVRAGPAEFEGLDYQLRETAQSGTSFSDTDQRRTITAVRLGSEPIASLALQGPVMADSVVQGIANLVAIGLERARAQDLAHQIEAVRQSEELRTTLIDAMAHEFKTPLTSIRAATTSLLSAPDQPTDTRTELIRIADEETEHLSKLIDDAVEMARLDTSRIEVQLAEADIVAVIRDVVDSMQKELDGRSITILPENDQQPILIDERLIRLAVRQLLDNALKYSPPGTPIRVNLRTSDFSAVMIEVTDFGHGIPTQEQGRVFDRFWRSPSVRQQMPGTGLGLSIAFGIARAHGGNLALVSRPGETTFRLTLPTHVNGDEIERRPHTRG